MKCLDSRWYWCTVALLSLSTGLQGYLIIDGLTRGVIVAHNRVGPSITYTLVGQPKHYWFTIAWLVITEIILMVLTFCMAWITRQLHKNK